MSEAEYRDYAAFGLRVRSAIPILGAIPLGEDGAVDLTIEAGPGGASTTASGEPYTLHEDGFTFAMPEVARYRYHTIEQRIVIDAAPNADPAMVGGMLIATMLPAAIWACGGFVIHAAAAIPPGAERAVAVMGPSRSGKSTLLAQMIAEGWTVVGEDSLALTQSGDAVIAAGLPGVRLEYAPDDRMWPANIPIPTDQQATRAPLGAIVVLSTNLNGDEAMIEPLPPAAAIDAILRNRHRPRIAGLLGIEPAALATVASLCRGVTIHRLTHGNPGRIALQPLAALARSPSTKAGE